MLVGGRRAHRRLDPASASSAIDRVPACGPLGGLDAALAAARDDALFCVACDMPFVTARAPAPTCLALAADADVVVPRTERGYHPLCAVYTRACQRGDRTRVSSDGDV